MCTFVFVFHLSYMMSCSKSLCFLLFSFFHSIYPCLFLFCFFFFFKQNTAYDMRISDWSSDVCSSDLSEKAICACADYTHGEIRKTIREQHLTSIPQTMRFLEWRTADGCASCRPALNYYLMATWPGEARDDTQSRLINERVHANIQKDGTYSVVPRMLGGVTNPSELPRNADVADKYHVPMVKVTGGQRIDLLGVKKEDLPAVWKDLDMPSGHAYGKSLRTVKTCVGKEFCRFGTQDSTGMGDRKSTRLNSSH